MEPLPPEPEVLTLWGQLGDQREAMVGVIAELRKRDHPSDRIAHALVILGAFDEPQRGTRPSISQLRSMVIQGDGFVKLLRGYLAAVAG